MIQDGMDIVADAVLRAQICIVGGGPAGITAAMRLVRHGFDVLLLESGKLKFDENTQTLNQGEVTDERLHSPPTRYRPRCFGGGTTIWGGRCVPFDRIDFDSRSWMPHSGWPISYADLEPYYSEANTLCEAGEYEYDARLAVPGGMRPMIRGFAPDDFDTDRIERFSCPTDFGKRYLNRLSPARVITNATVTRLRMSPDGSTVDCAEVRNLQGARFHVKATIFLLALGGIETPRLLLTSDDVHANGIGNANDLVGKYYMCHIAGTIGCLATTVPTWHGYDIAPDGTYCRRRIALRPEAQAREAVGNIVFRLHHPRIADPAHRTGALSAIYCAQRFISYEYAKRLASDSRPNAATWLRHLSNVLLDSSATLRFLVNWLRYRSLAERKFPSVIIQSRGNLFSLDFHGEQVPNPSSRVLLSGARDPFDNRRVRIDWRYCRQDVDTVACAFRLLQKEFVDKRIGSLTLAGAETNFEDVLRRDGAYGGHHIGTVRMGATPRQGVVDRNAQVFGVNNLYIAGSATFPTSSQANPTLTIVAMALRLADHLIARQQQSPTIRSLSTVA